MCVQPHHSIDLHLGGAIGHHALNLDAHISLGSTPAPPVAHASVTNESKLDTGDGVEAKDSYGDDDDYADDDYSQPSPDQRAPHPTFHSPLAAAVVSHDAPAQVVAAAAEAKVDDGDDYGDDDYGDEDEVSVASPKKQAPAAAVTAAAESGGGKGSGKNSGNNSGSSSESDAPVKAEKSVAPEGDGGDDYDDDYDEDF